MMANMILRKAVRFQKLCQSQTGGKMLPIFINPPNDSCALYFGLNNSLKSTQTIGESDLTFENLQMIDEDGNEVSNFNDLEITNGKLIVE